MIRPFFLERNFVSMVMSLLTKVFGSKNERELKKLQPAVDRINALEPAMQAMSGAELRAQTGRFKERVERGRPSMTCCRRRLRRCAKPRYGRLKCGTSMFKLIGGMVLHQGQKSPR